MLKIYAQQGPDVFLIAEDQDPTSTIPPAKGQVLDMRRKKLYAPMTFITIEAQGYWGDFNGDQADLPGMLAQVETQP